MKRRFGQILFAMTITISLHGWAQAPADTSSTTSGSTPVGPKPEYTHVDQQPSLNFLGEAAGSTGLTIGMGVGAAWDSNIAAFSPNGSLSQADYSFRPHIALTQLRPKTSLRFDYFGGLDLYSRFADTYSQNAGIDILHQLSPRWQVHVADNYNYSANPFDSYYTRRGVPTVNQPNPTFYYPFARTNQNVGNLDLTYVLGRHDSVSFDGTESFRRFGHYGNTNQGGINLYNMVSYGGGANYSHRFSPRLTVGGGYNYTSMDFGHGQQRSGIQSIRGSAEYQISPSMTLSGWFGPQKTDTKTIYRFFIFRRTIHTSQWNPAGGMTFNWRGQHDSVTAGFSHQVSDGGGILTTTHSWEVTGALRHQFNARWDGTASMMYGNNDSLAIRNIFPPRNFSSLWGDVYATRKISRAMNADLHYARIYQTQKNIYTAPTYTDNRYSVTLRYDWNTSLGR